MITRFLFTCLCLLCNNNDVFGLSINRKSVVRMLDADYTQIIQRYNGKFIKENSVDLVKNINAEKVSQIYISNDYNQAVEIDVADNFHVVKTNPIEITNLISNAYGHHIPINFIDFHPFYTNFQHVLSDILNVSGYLVPLVFLGLLLRGLSQTAGGGGVGGASSMIRRPGGGPLTMMGLNSRSPENELLKPNVSLNSWAGSPEVLEECREVVSYLEKKQNFLLAGAEMPKGILLEGPPGTGKTLLAKGIATETNSTFITASGSEFVELFVGMGAARVRELFKNARDNSPCIIFIDEIDAIGKQRGSSSSMAANDEREQTLNQILFEMDGFKNNEGLLILAATNRKDILDKALLRPGRFDRIIKVPLPDKFSREKILSYYLSLKTVEDVDIKALSEITDGFSGAELKNLVNEAAILTARQNKITIGEKELFDAFEKLIVGLIRKNNSPSETTQNRVAVHESGHALMALQYPQYFDLQKVSIQSTYSGAGGYTLFTEKPEVKEGGLYTRDFLKKRLIVTMGGKAAENVYYGKEYVSVGAIQDLKQANQLSRKMIGNYGMGDILEVFSNENVNDDAAGSGFFGSSSKYSDRTLRNMDRESLNLVIEAYNESLRILNENRHALSEFKELLLEKTTLNRKDIPEHLIPDSPANE